MRKPLILAIAIVAITAGVGFAWTEPVKIDGELHLGAPRAVAVGETLHVIAVNPPRAYYIYSRDNGATWSEPVMPIDTSRRVEQPDLRYSNGTLHLVWREVIGFPGTWQLFHARSTDSGRSWSVPHQVFNNRTDYLAFPTLAVKGDSLFMACVMDGGYPFFRSFDGGQSWPDSTIIDWGDFGIIQYPRLRYAGNVLHFVYPMLVNGDPFAWEVYYKKSADLGLTWSERIILSPAESSYIPSQIPYASADSSGRVLVTWMDYANGSMCGTSGDIFYRVSLDNGQTWQPIGSITNTQSGEDSYSLILGDRFLVAWNDNWLLGCSYPKQAYSTSVDSGWSWHVPQFISGADNAHEGGPRIVHTIQGADTTFHCFYWKRTEANPGSLFYIRSRDFVAVDEPGPPLTDKISLVAYPNPFNSSTIISVTSATEGELAIYNTSGQLVKRFEILEGGDGRIIWDATDMAGEEVSSGVYIVKYESSGRSVTEKVIYSK